MKKHISMGWIRKEPQPFYFPNGYNIVNYNGSQEQRSAFFYIWNEREGTQKEIDEAFLEGFENKKDCNIEKDMFFVEYNGEYIGTVTALHHPKNNLGHIHYFAIRKDYRGKRLSYPLLYVAMKKIFDDGSDFAFLVTDDWRRPAIKVYLKYGFIPKINRLFKSKETKKWRQICKELGFDHFQILNKRYKVINQ